MATIEKLMLDKIAIKMKKFNMQEIQQLVKILHLNLGWKDIINLVSECRLRLTIANVVSIVNHHLKETDKIEATYHRVLLVDAIFHKGSQWWTVSVDKVNKRLLDKERIRNNIQAVLDKLNIKAVAYVMKNNDLFWVLINVKDTKKKKTSVKLDKPYFFTIAPGKMTHVFYKPQIIDSRLLKIVTKAIGANKSKPYALSGKHLQSMVHMLNNKDKENEQENVQLSSDKHHREEDVREYVQRLFEDNRRILNEFTINVDSDMSVFGNTDPLGKMCKTKIELKGDNIIDSVRDMMLSGVFQPPYPDWVTRLPVMSKNSITVNIRP